MPSNSENFRRFPNKYFIETGSFTGDGINQALEAGFQNVISIELSDKYFKECSDRFSGDSRVKVVKGDSYKMLPDVLREIDEPATFWLDGHHSCGDTALGDYWAPLMQELNAIKDHDIKNHTLLIDDMRCWQEPNPVHGFWKEDIFNILKEINPDYQISYLDGCCENDILVASVK